MIAADPALPGNDKGASARPGGATGRQDGIAHGAGPERLWPTLSSGGVGISDCGEHRRARNRLGPARTTPFRPDPPRRIRGRPAGTDGQVPPPQSREPASLLQTVLASVARADLDPGPGSRKPTLTSSYAISVGFSAVTAGNPRWRRLAGRADLRALRVGLPAARGAAPRRHRAGAPGEIRVAQAAGSVIQCRSHSRITLMRAGFSPPAPSPRPPVRRSRR